MATLTVIDNLTLDGVMQAPGRRDEDGRDGFVHGGWAIPYDDAVKGQALAGGMAVGSSGGAALLLGRRTYEDFAGFWPQQTGNPFTPVLDAMQKYVVSTTLRNPLPWQNSTVVPGDAATSVAALKRGTEQDLVVLGSGELVRTLAGADLVDEYVLLIHPLVLGAGRRLFDATGPRADLVLVQSVTTTTGVIIATYRPSGRTAA